MTLSSRIKQRIAEFQATIIDNPYIPHEPTEKQAKFLFQSDHLEGFYGGAARGGKTDALLMAALQYVSIPSYAALLLRRTYTDLSLPDALMDRAERWFINNEDISWHEKTKTWTFPSGATLTFGFLESERDKYRYQGAALQYVGFDELSQFTESQYSYLFSRLTRLEGINIPLRMRAASNPGGIGHSWVKRRFITPLIEEMRKQNRFFIPAFLEDNPHVDQEAYEQSLNRLDPVTREQLRHGNWDIAIAGNMFKREWFEIVDAAPQSSRQVRFWDMAATEQKKGKDPDWTVGCLLAEKSGIFYVENITRFQKTPADTEKIIKQTAQIDGIGIRIYAEQEPGASGKIAIDHYARDILKGFSFIGIPSTGSKVTRAQPLSAAAQNGNVKIVNGSWIGDMLSELVLFPTKGVHDDIVDAMSGAFNELNQVKPAPPSCLSPGFSPVGVANRI